MPARLISREYFDLDETETRSSGRRSGEAIRLGDPVTVRVQGIEAPRGRVDLAPAGDPGERLSGRARAKAGGRRNG